MNICKKIILLAIMLCSTVSLAESFNFDVDKEVIDKNQIVYQINMAKGEKVRINESYMSLLIHDLIDSRCPPGKACLWEGELVLRMQMRQGGFVENLSLVYRDSSQSQATLVGNYALSIIEVISNEDESYNIKLRLSSLN